jgi:hypothetical protein
MKQGYFLPVFGPCPECKKTIQRIGYYKRDFLIGYLGVNCSFCKCFKKPDINEIEKPLTKMIPDKEKLRYKRKKGIGVVIRPKSL